MRIQMTASKFEGELAKINCMPMTSFNQDEIPQTASELVDHSTCIILACHIIEATISITGALFLASTAGGSLSKSGYGGNAKNTIEKSEECDIFVRSVHRG